MQPQTFVDEQGRPVPIPIQRDGNGNPVVPFTLASGVNNNSQDNFSNTKVTMGTALDEDIDAVTAYDKGVNYAKFSGDGVVSNTPVAVFGYEVQASSSGAISFFDHPSSATGNTIMLTGKTVAKDDIVMLAKPIITVSGLFFKLVSGTATVNVFTRKITAQ